MVEVFGGERGLKEMLETREGAERQAGPEPFDLFA